jgi:hypothetical protein
MLCGLINSSVSTTDELMFMALRLLLSLMIQDIKLLLTYMTEHMIHQTPTMLKHSNI